VPTDDLVVLPGETAVTDVRVLPDGDRVFEREEFGVTADYRPSDAEVATIATAAWVHLGMVPDATGLRARLAAAGAGTISQDCAVAEGMSGLDVAFLSAGEGGDADALAARALAAGVATVVVTLGADGALGRSAGRADAVRQAALPTDVVDTTGAGDSFIAGFVAARLLDASLADALANGARTAAATVGHRAGWPHPRREVLPR
jgi:fructoselysine 6-kinase